MRFAVYLIGAWLFTRFGRTVFPPGRMPGSRYPLLAWLTAALGVVVFELLSVAAGIVRYGTAVSITIPGDYVARGPIGTAILALGGLAIMSPLGVALIMRGMHSRAASRS